MRSPNLASLIRDSLEGRLRDLHTAIPAEVVKYDAAKQTVDVQPVVKRVDLDPDGVEVVEPYPQIPNVPVAFPRAGGYFVSLPIAAGDTVLLVFCERAIDQWRARDKRDTDPADLRLHSTSDAVAIPGVFATAKANAGANKPHMVIGKEGGPQIHVKDAEISLFAEAAADAVALASLVNARFAAIESFLASHVHGGVTTGGGVSGVAAGAPSGSSTASTKVKAE